MHEHRIIKHMHTRTQNQSHRRAASSRSTSLALKRKNTQYRKPNNATLGTQGRAAETLTQCAYPIASSRGKRFESLKVSALGQLGNLGCSGCGELHSSHSDLGQL